MSAPPPLREADRVTLFGLTGRADLNGRCGKIGHRASGDRWAVVLDGSAEVVSVREANLVHTVDYDSDDQYNASRAAKRQRTAGPPAPLQPSSSSVASPADDFFVPDPPPPAAAFVRAKEAARAKAKPPGSVRASSRMRGWGGREPSALRHGCSLAEPYEPDRDDARLEREPWVANEKFDGCRAVWHPKHADGPGFRTRSGAHVVPPPGFCARLPDDIQLAGELWAGRRHFAAVGALIGSRGLGSEWHECAWRSLTYIVFDAPRAGGGYLERLDQARARLARVASAGSHARVVVAPTVAVPDAAAKVRLLEGKVPRMQVLTTARPPPVQARLLERVVSAGGEGLVLRRVAAPWRAGSEGRSQLKVKQWLDAEAVVLANQPAPAASNLPGARHCMLIAC